MQRNILIYLLPLALALGLGLDGCTKESVRSDAGSAARMIRERFIAGIDRLDSSVAHLRSAVSMMKRDAATAASARSAFLDARRAYKRIEFLAEQYMPSTARSINGPPIDKVAEDDPNQVVLPAEGLQVVEAALLADEPDRDATLAQVEILAANIRRLRAYATTVELSDANIFDGMRREVVRVIALGLAGFDASIALTGIEEGGVALEGVRDAYAHYADGLERKSPSLRRSLDTLFERAIADLHTHRGERHDGDGFNAFDRLEFIRRRANPLFAQLLEAQKALAIPVADDRRALRSDAVTIFAASSFDPYAYAPGFDDSADAERVELGRILFFDPILSGNGRRACASCHQPELAFTDGRAKSLAFDFKGEVLRNAPTLINAALQSGAFYDGRVAFLEDQATEVFNNPREMHGSLPAAAEKLKMSAEYAGRFERAFPGHGDEAISSLTIRSAIASYIRSLVSLDAPFDRYIRGETSALDDGAKRGFNLFMGKGKCGTCHFMPLFNGTVPPSFAESELEIIGVPSHYDTIGAALDPDVGRFAVHHIEHDRFKFKTPTLRNIALTAPYMHNGAFTTLEQVLDFYNRGGGAGIGIDVPGQTLPADPLGLTQEEMRHIIAFMRALTDTTGVASRPGKLPVVVEGGVRRVGGEY